MFVFPRETELSDALSEVASLKAEVSRMGEEKSDLMAKIEDGEGASTALKQLQQQNVREKIVFSKKNPKSNHLLFVNPRAGADDGAGGTVRGRAQEGGVQAADGD